MMRHHHLFEKFTTFAGDVEPGFVVDFLGCKTRLEFLPTSHDSPTGRIETSYPPVDEEYFEWIDILESVIGAKGTYTFVELGAGYGRWAVRAAAAARQAGNLPFRLVAVEAEPNHFEWLRTHFRDNGIDPEDHFLHRAAVSNEKGSTFFYVGMPEGGQDSPNQWYGQAITKSYETVEEQTESNWKGSPVFKHKSGWRSIEVPLITLDDTLVDLEHVDLIDLDVQGEELKVISSTIDTINQKVKRLHIGTHDHDIERGLRELLSNAGWECRADFQCLATNETPWGPVPFVDGVQSWVNRSLL